MRTRYSYLGETTIEVVIDGQSVDVNILPAAAAALAEVPVAAPAAPPDIGAAAAGLLLASPLGEPVVAAPPPHGRGFYAILRFLYTSLACILGMIGAGAKYLLDHLNDLSDINWTVVGIALAGALLAGVLYGLKKYFRPDPNSIF